MKTDEWTTPQGLFDKLDALFHFTLDAAATPENTKCKKFWTRDDMGYMQPWDGECVFINPPYSMCEKWIDKVCREALKGITIVAIVPARVGTEWWMAKASRADFVLFIRKRVKFLGIGKSNAPFWSAILVYNWQDSINGLKALGSIGRPER